MTAIVKDTFTDIDGTNLANHIADTGQSWTIYESPLTITSNQLSSQTTNESLGWIETGISDFDFSVNIETHGIEEDIYFRYQDYNNWIRISTYGTTNIYLQKKVNGSKSTVKSGTTSFPANSVLDINANGSTINVTMNGTVIFSNVSITDLTTATKVGLGTWNSPNTRYDNLEVDSLTSSSTTYIGSGTATGQSSLTSNETLILSEHGTITGKSNLTSNETQILSASGTITGRSNLSSAETFTSVGSSGSILSASGTVTGQSLLQSRETMTYASSGQIMGQSRLTSNDRLIMPESGTIHGQSRLSSGEIYVYSERGTIQGQSSLISHENIILSAGGVITGKSNLESLETILMMASGTITGESNLLSHETFQSVLRVIRTITLQGDRQLHFVIQASRQLHITLQGSRQLHITLKGGVDMAVNNETQEIYQGQSAIIDIPNITDDNNTLNLNSCTAITFVAKRGGNVISKDLTNGVTAVDSSTLKIELDPIDTNLPYGLYSYQIWCTDDQGEVTPLATGTLNLITSMVIQ